MPSAQIRLHGVAPESIVDGPGVRYAIFTQGCPHHCEGCHNPGSHSFEAGYNKDIRILLADILENPLLSGVTFSGGEPFMQAEALCELGRLLRQHSLPIMTFTGYTLEELKARAEQDAAVAELLALSDMLVDGPFVQTLMGEDLVFRGSSNQRIWHKEQGAWCLGA